MFLLLCGHRKPERPVALPQLKIQCRCLSILICKYPTLAHLKIPLLMARPAAAAPQGCSKSSNKSDGESSLRSSSSGDESKSTVQHCNNPNVPSGTVFYQWVVSPVCDKICPSIPSWVHPDLISFLGLCCASAAAYCCCAAKTTARGGELALAAAFWILYGLFDNLDGKQARRLGLCSAGGDFFDHSSDSVSSSFAALIILHMLCTRIAAPIAAATTAGEQQECVSLAFLHYIPGLRALLPSRGLDLKICFQPAATLNMHPSMFNFCFIMLSQMPFFISTWAHPIVGRTMLSASVDGPGNFSVDELNFLVIPGLLLLKSRHPWVFSVSCIDAIAAIPVVGPLLSPYLLHYFGEFRGFEVLFLQQQMTLGFSVLIASVTFSIVQSSILLKKLLSAEHLPRFLPGMAFFMSTFWFGPPLGLQIICFSLLCLELIAARLKLHVRSLLYLWFPVSLYTLFCLCLTPPPILQQLATDSGLSTMFKGDADSPYLLWRMVYRIRRSYELHELFAVFSFAVLFCCLFIYKHIINRRNHPRCTDTNKQKQE